MPLPAFEQIVIADPLRLAVYRNYNKYDDYLKATDITYYNRLNNPLITVIDDVPIQNRMVDAIYFFASKGVGELTQILRNFDISAEIINGVQKYFGPDYGAMNGGLRTKLDVAGQNLDFNQILALYEKIVNPNLANKYIYNTLKAFTKTTPSEELFYVFRCYQQLPNGVPLFEANGDFKPGVYLNQFTSTSILLRLCDFWCTPSPINFSNNTDPTNYQPGDNTIICIEIPIGTRGISLINYAGIVDGQLTTTYSEFEYLLPPGGTLELTDTTYSYESITRAQFLENYVQRGLDVRLLNLPTRFNIPIYRYVSVKIPDNRTQKSILHRAYVYILPIRGFLIRTINYVRDSTSRMSARVANFMRGNRNPYGMLVEAEGRRLRKLRKRTRKYTRKQVRKYSRKRVRKNSIRKKYKIEI